MAKIDLSKFYIESPKNANGCSTAYPAEVIARSTCLFSEHHNLYDDSYEDCLFFDPVAGLFGADSWTTAAGCNHYCPQPGQFAHTWNDIPEDQKETIIKLLQESIKADPDYLAFKMSRNDKHFNSLHNRYSYQKAAFENVFSTIYARRSEIIDSIKDIDILLLLSPLAESSSYKNQKDSIRYRCEGKWDGTMSYAMKCCGVSFVPKRERVVKLEGDCYVGKIVSMFTEPGVVGYRSVVCIAPENGKKVYFNEPAMFSHQIGETIKVYGKSKEYAKSIKLRYTKVDDNFRAK